MGVFYNTDKTFDQIIKEKTNFVFIGEAGSGKSTIALNLAAMLAKKGGKTVDLFDMDQSKPMFRTRELSNEFADKNINIKYQSQFADAPTLVPGVDVSLMNDDKYTILDIGGGEYAARVAGAFAKYLKQENSVPVYVINPYRPWAKTTDTIDGTMAGILGAMKLERIYVLGNPNLGYTTTSDDFMKGLEMIDERMGEFVKMNSAVISSEIYEETKKRTDMFLMPLKLYLNYSWIYR